MKAEVLHSLLIDVRERGAAIIEKRKLLWMLDRANESPTAWKALYEEWLEVGGRPKGLYGFQHGDLIVLTARPSDEVATTWANL